MDAHVALVILLLIFLAIIAILSSDRSFSVGKGIIDKFLVGNYLAGFPGVKEEKPGVRCAVDESAYTLMLGGETEIGRIPRDGVIDIFYEEKTKLLPRLTVTKELSFGSLKLDNQKALQKGGYCLVIDWDDNFGARHNTVFEFTGMSAATLAHKSQQALRKYQKPHLPRLRSDEKKCPLCAEIIKKEAMICRFCGQRV